MSDHEMPRSELPSWIATPRSAFAVCAMYCASSSGELKLYSIALRWDAVSGIRPEPL
jgi:hypothetical protein